MNVTLRQLQAFLAVAELGSFTRASERLRLSQSALSVMVSGLEQNLRLRLFDRTTRRVALTEPGRQFQAAAAKAVADLDHAIHNAHMVADRRRGRISIAAPPLLAAGLLPRVLARHRTVYPGIDINLIDAPTDQIIAKLRLGEADVAIGTFAPDIEEIDRVLLLRDRLVVVCQPAHPLADRDEVPWSAIAGHAVIMLTHASGIRTLVEQSWPLREAPLRPAFEVTQISTAIALAEEGLGVTILPSYTVGRHQRLVCRKLIDPEVGRNVEFVRMQGKGLSPAAASLLNLLLTACSPEVTLSDDETTFKENPTIHFSNEFQFQQGLG